MMTKALPAIIATVLISGMSIFAFMQSGTIQDQGKTIKDQSEEIIDLKDEVQAEIEAQEFIKMDRDYWQELAILRADSIQLLQTEMKELKSAVRKYKKQLKSFKAQIAESEQKYAELKSQISELVRLDEIDRATIASLEVDKAELRQQIANLTIQKEEVTIAKEETEAELLDRKVSEARFKRITDLVNNTSVRFNKVHLSKDRLGKPINRIKRENSKWKYTIIEIFLDNQDLKLLLDEEFIVKIVNSDTGEILSYIESNPNFPDSEFDSKGVKFKYDGNMVEVSYFNNQQKIGENYEIQIFYISEGEEYLLLNGAKPFIKNKKVIQ